MVKNTSLVMILAMVAYFTFFGIDVGPLTLTDMLFSLAILGLSVLGAGFSFRKRQFQGAAAFLTSGVAFSVWVFFYKANNAPTESPLAGALEFIAMMSCIAASYAKAHGDEQSS